MFSVDPEMWIILISLSPSHLLWEMKSPGKVGGATGMSLSLLSFSD